MNKLNLIPTPIMDYDNPLVAEAVESIFAETERDFLRKAHHHVMQTVYPIYNIDELQPVSVTLQKAKGSCTQRTAYVEAMARAVGIPTRARVLWVSGKFWYPRFPLWAHPFMPNRTMLLWPEFHIDDKWLDFSEIFAPLEALASHSESGFTNSAETLFDAIAVRPVDFKNHLQKCECGDAYDLSSVVVADGGLFSTRDAALEHYGSFQHTWRGVAFQLLFAGKTIPIADPSLIQQDIYEHKDQTDYATIEELSLVS
jgi:hypothetical protein